MCSHCDPRALPALPASPGRRLLLLAAAAAALPVLPARAQVDVGAPSTVRNLMPAEVVENAGVQQYAQLLAQARAQGALAGEKNAQLQRLRAIGARIIPFTGQWNARASQWKWEINLIGSKQVNAFCLPGGKIAFFSGLLEQLRLSDDEVAMVMGHEMAHALREHARAQMVKRTGTGVALSAGAQWLGLGDVGDLAARGATQLLGLKFSRSDESDADLVGLELAARAGYDPKASVSLWQKMAAAQKGGNGLSFLSTHPSGPNRIKTLRANVPKVEGLYRAAKRGQ